MRHVLILTALMFPAPAEAGRFQQFDLPGSASTCGTSVASDGVVAGVGAGVPGQVAASLLPYIPFFWKAGSFQVPALGLPAGQVYPAGVNRWHALVGIDLLSGTLSSEIFKIRNGAVTVLDGLNVSAINDGGTILQTTQRVPPVPFSFNQVAALQSRSGGRTVLDDGTGTMDPLGMDGLADRVVGRSIGPNGWQAWSWHGGVFTPVVVPAATLLTSPTGVNAQGRITGTYYSGTLTSPVAHGFIVSGGTVATWDVPVRGAVDTQVMGANEKGEVTGCFTDGAGLVHGFVAIP